MNPNFDLSLLPKAIKQFVIVSDTHYVLPDAGKSLEFPSRNIQSARAETALSTAAALPKDFSIHLGDLVQEYPDTPQFSRAIDEALTQLQNVGLSTYKVAGNHDVGDKPDATMPTHHTNKAHLDFYHEKIGCSYYAFDCGPLRGIVLNSQIFNSEYSEPQKKFFEQELTANSERRIAVFCHLPPYLFDDAEADAGHYDNIGKPDRQWLLKLLVKHDVELFCCGHVHFAFFDRVKNTRVFICPSTSFTRPGFGHLFTSSPPPEQGRDDKNKLGFYYARILDNRIDIHFIRTGGVEHHNNYSTRVLTRLPSSLANAPLGITFTHLFCPTTEVPITFPSVVRQRIRNDYPLLACLEIGATCVRVPWTDLHDPLQRNRLHLLRDEGVAVHVFVPSHIDSSLHTLLDRYTDQVDLWELQLMGESLPDDNTLALLSDCHRRTQLSLSIIKPFQPIEGKQHPRPRIGFLVSELPALNKVLAESSVSIDCVRCRMDEDFQPKSLIKEFHTASKLSHIGNIDWLFSLPYQDDDRNALIAARAFFTCAGTPNARIFFDPPQDLDRTMDVTNGLLDSQCNPRSTFHVLRTLNTLLHVNRQDGYICVSDGQNQIIRSSNATVHLLMPNQIINPSPKMHLYNLSNCSKLEVQNYKYAPALCAALYPH